MLQNYKIFIIMRKENMNENGKDVNFMHFFT